MAIRFSSTAPADGPATIETHLSRSRRTATDTGMRMLRAQPDVELGEGIEAWTLDLSAAEDGSGLAGAKPRQWRYVVFEGQRPVAEAHLRTSATGSVVSAMAHGPTTAGLVEALGVAERLPQVAEVDYEPRVLLVPSIVLTALWLHAEDNDGADDLVIPFPPNRTALDDLAAHDAATVEAAITKAAAEVRAQMNAAPGPSGGSGAGRAAPGAAVAVPRCLRLRGLDLGHRPGHHAHQHAPHQHAPHQQSPHQQSPQQQSPQQQPPEDEEVEQTLPEFMQPQEQSNWCWSAVGTSVGLLFETGSWTQCTTATALLTSGDCCTDPGPCNVYGYLDKSLTYTKSLASWDSGTTTTTEIRSNVDAGHPVCTRVAWTGGGAHFMAITGYAYSTATPDAVTIWIQDSIYGTSSMLYTDYPADYQSGGTWTHTYFTTPGS